MKKIILLLCLFCALNSFSQSGTVTPTSGASTKSLQAVETNTLFRIRKGIDTTNQTLRYTLKDESGNTAISRLSDINVNTYNSNTNLSLLYTIGTQLHEAYIIRKLDSLNNVYMLTEVSATVTSANTGTAVGATQVIGSTGVYSVTLPSGNWQITSVIITSSVQVSTDAFRIWTFSGSQNLATYAEGAAFTPSINEMIDFKSAYFSNSASGHFVLGSRGVNFMIWPVSSSVLNGIEFYSGSTPLKFAFTYNAAFTPAANNVYYIRFRLRRMN